MHHDHVRNSVRYQDLFEMQRKISRILHLKQLLVRKDILLLRKYMFEIR